MIWGTFRGGKASEEESPKVARLSDQGHPTS